MSDTIKQLTRWTDTHRGEFIDFVRIYLGIGLFLKAIHFITDTDYLVKLISDAGDMWFAPAAISHVVILAHLVGGFLLAIGLLTRVAALIQIPVLVYAVFYVYLPKMFVVGPRENLEFSVLVLFLLTLLFLYGPGRWSVDYYIFKKTDSPGAPS